MNCPICKGAWPCSKHSCVASASNLPEEAYFTPADSVNQGSGIVRAVEVRKMNLSVRRNKMLTKAERDAIRAAWKSHGEGLGVLPIPALLDDLDAKDMALAEIASIPLDGEQGCNRRAATLDWAIRKAREQMK